VSMSGSKIAFVACIVSTIGCGPARTQSLEQAIQMALDNSPTVGASQANLALSYEQREAAGAAGRMRVQAAGSASQRSDKSETLNFAGRETEQDRTSQRNSVSLTVSQPLYTGGRLTTSLALSERRINAANIALAASELTLTRNTAAAYAELVRAETVNTAVSASVSNLAVDLAGANARFRAGEVSITDVAQSESRLASVQGQAARSQSDLTAAWATFERFVGVAPYSIQSDLPIPPIPATQNEFVDAVLSQNFDIQAAKARYETAQATVNSASTARNPSVSLDAGYEKRWNDAFAGSRSEGAQITARVVVPLWDGGAASSGVRQAIAQASIARFQLADIEREARANASRAWANYFATQTILEAAKRQVTSAELARRGALAELRFGLRSTIEALNQEVELRQAITNQAAAKRDHYIACIDLAALMGLTPLGTKPRSLDPIARSAIPPPRLSRPLLIERPIYTVMEFLEANDRPVASAARDLNQAIESSKRMGPIP
jgi:outer membrane protein